MSTLGWLKQTNSDLKLTFSSLILDYVIQNSKDFH